jgi:hypothetical protein
MNENEIESGNIDCYFFEKELGVLNRVARSSEMAGKLLNFETFSDFLLTF